MSRYCLPASKVLYSGLLPNYQMGTFPFFHKYDREKNWSTTWQYRVCSFFRVVLLGLQMDKVWAEKNEQHGGEEFCWLSLIFMRCEGVQSGLSLWVSKYSLDWELSSGRVEMISITLDIPLKHCSKCFKIRQHKSPQERHFSVRASYLSRPNIDRNSFLPLAKLSNIILTTWSNLLLHFIVFMKIDYSHRRVGWIVHFMWQVMRWNFDEFRINVEMWKC